MVFSVGEPMIDSLLHLIHLVSARESCQDFYVPRSTCLFRVHDGKHREELWRSAVRIDSEIWK